MIASSRLTFKLHRFELSLAAVAGILVGLVAILVSVRLSSIEVTADCFTAWLAGTASGGCADAVDRFSQINGDEAGKVFAAMALLPFFAGLLTGVPLVGREIEARTAQTAWFLSPSRRRWFGRQVLPVLVLLAGSIAVAAIGASILQSTRGPLVGSSMRDIGLHGPTVVARAVAAFGIGLLCGAAIGRTLPAFIVGAGLALVLAFGLSTARDAWISTEPMQAFDQAATQAPGFDAILFEQGWRDQSGTIVTETELAALVPTNEAADPYAWLTSNGYEVVQLGLPANAVRGWEPIEFVVLLLIAGALTLLTIVLVERRRAT